VRRALRGQRVHEAHRSHAYQWLARRWHSHLRVTATALVVNLFWLFPCALVATLFTDQASWMVIVAFVPLAVLAVLAGAGKSESPA
jgi:Fuc2NAc and GlcNAc transferase